MTIIHPAMLNKVMQLNITWCTRIPLWNKHCCTLKLLTPPPWPPLTMPPRSAYDWKVVIIAEKLAIIMSYYCLAYM